MNERKSIADRLYQSIRVNLRRIFWRSLSYVRPSCLLRNVDREGMRVPERITILWVHRPRKVTTTMT